MTRAEPSMAWDSTSERVARGERRGGSDGAGCRRRHGGRGSVGSRAWHPSRPQLRRDKEEDELHLVLGFNEEDDLNCTCGGLR